MKNVLERFERLAAAHQINEPCAAAMRVLLGEAHTAGFSAHMALSEAAHDDEDALRSVEQRSAEPDDEEEDDERSAPSYASYAALHMAMHSMVKKTIRKELKRGLRKHTRAQKKAARKVIARAAATHPGAAALGQ